jgi:CheY-like chemotaxis protein
VAPPRLPQPSKFFKTGACKERLPLVGLLDFTSDVLEAEDGYAALSLLAKSSPDLVIVDYAMPGLTGVEMVRELRLKRPDLPILFVSGYAKTAAMEKVVDENISVLRKPFEISKLHEVMSRLFQKSQE